MTCITLGHSLWTYVCQKHSRHHRSQKCCTRWGSPAVQIVATQSVRVNAVPPFRKQCSVCGCVLVKSSTTSSTGCLEQLCDSATRQHTPHKSAHSTSQHCGHRRSIRCPRVDMHRITNSYWHANLAAPSPAFGVIGGSS
jgi:hypothetical protein